MPREAILDAEALQSLGGRVVQDGMSLGGWTIQSRHRPIIGDAEIEQYKADLGGVISIPEIIFGNSYLKITHEESQTFLSFTALDALKEWKAEDLAPLQVNIAEQWQEARQSEIVDQGAKQLEYDWTFTTPYSGTIGRRTDSNGAAGTVPAPHFVDSDIQIDWELLKSQDPIIFFDSFTLYESELNDTGACQYEVKIRCMPTCWFVLSRFWLRVDENLIRLREARIFCRYDSSGDIVLRELQHSEGTFAELVANGAPPEGPAYKDSDSTAHVLQSMAPRGLKLVKLEKLDVRS